MSTKSTSSPRESDFTPGPQNRTLSIFLISVLGLFLELMLIRWIGTEIRIFAYLQNTVLVVCFLGLGMGCFTCRKPVVMRHVLIPMVVLALLLAIPFTRRAFASITDMLSVLGDTVIWAHAVSEGPWSTIGRVSMGLCLTLALMCLLWETFVPIGRLLGRLLDDHPRTIWAYSVNVAGSLIGIWLFVALSAFSMPPVVWLGVSVALMVWFLNGSQDRLLNFGLAAALLILGFIVDYQPSAIESTWSPYQKLVLIDPQQESSPNSSTDGWVGKCIMVNNTGYQGMIDLSPEGIAKNSQIPADAVGMSQYDVPLRFKPNPRNVLIVGAGSGNDVAGALRGGAQRVTGVEIDPVIIEMGRRHHEERPYDSEKVTVVNDNARSYFATTDQTFDLIIFGLLDSHTTTAMTNARLDHYVYTVESLSRARQLLTDDGVMVLSFEALKPYIADRMASCIQQVFGREPLAFRIPATTSGWGGAFFVAGNQQEIQQRLASDQQLADKISQWQAAIPMQLTYNTRIATDDWPYIYLKTPSIPSLYYLLGATLFVLLGYGMYRIKLNVRLLAWERAHWHFFFMGAAFLLLEVQNISKASVVLGNTWLVNAVIISGILTMILLANVIAARFPKLPQDVVAAFLVGSCLAIYLVDLSRFGFLPYPLKATIVGTLTTLPMLFAGIIFIDSFARIEHKDRALGANLFGALVGGLLQSVTFVLGIKALLLIVAALYTAAIMTRPQTAEVSESEDEQDADWNIEQESDEVQEDVEFGEPLSV